MPSAKKQPKLSVSEKHVRASIQYVPLLSTEGKLIDVLEMKEGEDLQTLNRQDIEESIHAHLQQRAENRAVLLQYQELLHALSEGIWHMTVSPPMPLNLPVEEQVAYLLHHTHLSTFNESFQKLVQGVETETAPLVDLTLGELFPTCARQLLRDWIESGYQLKNALYTQPGAQGDTRHLMISLVGSPRAAGYISNIWGSVNDITERVQLEQRFVHALEEQQKRIGRDLHDGVGQLMTGLRMLSENLEQTFVDTGTVDPVALHRLVELARETQEQLRKVYKGLTPVELYHEGLAAALNRLVQNINELPDVEAGFMYDFRADVWEHETKTQLFRIAQEAVNNALKHGKPSRIAISLTTERNTTTLSIRDNGIGFDVRATYNQFQPSLGLQSMKYRARAINADLYIRSTPGKGTLVECILYYT